MVTTQAPRASTFPVDWNDSLDAGVTFMLDAMHFPYPESPLFQSTMGPAFSAGFTTAVRECDLPIDRYETFHRNHYHFDRMVMKQPATDEEVQHMGKVAEAAMQREVGRMAERWHGEHLPGVTSLLNRLRELDVAGASPGELAAILDEVDKIHTDLWVIHFRTVLPMHLALQLFDEFYADVFGGAESDGHELMVGTLSEGITSAIGLSDLAALARELGLEPLFRETATDVILPALESTDPGRQFLARLNVYLDDYGLKQDLMEYTAPTWQEDPSVALASIRTYLLSGRDARAEHEAKVQSAQAATTAARDQLAAYPEAVRGQFEAMLQFGRDAYFLLEEHHFYIDQQGIALLRLFYLKVGQWLVDSGVIENADDIFMLRIEEVRSLVTGAGAGQKADDVRATIATRRDEMSRARAMTPPPFIGDPPAGPPPSGSPLERGLARFFGGPPQLSDVPGQLKGNAGSKGVASGTARIARTLEDASHVQPGEILVAVTTMPAWTPLFGIAAAVITETGGALSHCAIVAREYGIPAVVGAHGATTAITPGQRISVDGSRGIVTIDA